VSNKKKRPDPVLAREKSLEVLTSTGMTSLKRGAQKVDNAIAVIFRFGFSSSANLELIAQTIRSGFGSRLVQKNLAKRVEVRYPSGHGQTVFYLTPDGLDRARQLTNSTSAYSIPKRISTKNLRHDLLAQTLTIKMLNAGQIVDYLTPRELKNKSMANFKEFDVVWLSSKSKIGVEVELSAKFGKALDHFVYSCVLALNPDSDEEDKYTTIIIYLEEQSLVGYSAAFKAGTKLKVWDAIGDIQEWKLIEEITIPEWVQKNVLFKLLE
jgi:hypothetical protein